MTPNPILKVLSIFKQCEVKSMLIGGQACIIYGAAEFSRDSDFVILCEPGNLSRLKKALRLVRAKAIYVPSLEPAYLERGHACHFRCFAKGVERLRIDLLAKLRGCGDFDELWSRRKSVKLAGGGTVEVLSLEDLVTSKKTQRDKDWLMLKRLINNDIYLTKRPAVDKFQWWLLECRSAPALVALANKRQKTTLSLIHARPLLKQALKGDVVKVETLLRKEESVERENDRAYWLPLIRELEQFRHKKAGGRPSGRLL